MDCWFFVAVMTSRMNLLLNEQDHNYIVEANLFTGVLTLTQTETLAPAYDQLYFVGNVRIGDS